MLVADPWLKRPVVLKGAVYSVPAVAQLCELIRLSLVQSPHIGKRFFHL